MKEQATAGDQRPWAEPWKVKVVELLTTTTGEQRQTALEDAG